MTQEEIAKETAAGLIERIALIQLLLEQKKDELHMFSTGVKELNGIPEAGVLNNLQMVAYTQFLRASNDFCTWLCNGIGKKVRDMNENSSK